MMATNIQLPVELSFNCGFARVAVREITVGIGKSEDLNMRRTQSFRELFDAVPNYYSNPNMFDQHGHRESTFNRNCKRILHKLNTWPKKEVKQKYLHEFSTKKWKSLPIASKKRHTLQNCRECAIQHTDLQQKFPGKSLQLTDKFSSGLSEILSTEDENTATRTILADLQPVYQERFGHSFTESLMRLPGSKLQQKPTDVQKKRVKRQIQRECRDHMESQYKESDAITVLAEGISLRTYNRVRKAEGFETPAAKRARVENVPPKERKHSPTLEKATWDKVEVLKKLKEWPKGTVINWTKFARENNVQGGNKGQIIKEFAAEHGIDVKELDKREPGTRVRAKKLKFPGKDISVPVHRTVAQIKEDWAKMILDGELTLGEQCNPYNITKFSTKSGELKKTTTTLYGRKIPLQEVRQKLLDKHEKFMYLHSDRELAQMDKETLLHHYHKRGLRLPDELTEENLRKGLQQAERTRTIAMWHDHAKLLGRGYVLVTAKILYDRAAFLDDTDIPKPCNIKDIQSFIEEPEIHILAVSSSTIEDQAALVRDRISCISSLNKELTCSKGVTVKDTLMFFCGDKPAAQFERGANQGGEFPCANCGCPDSRMDDLAHSFNLKFRSLKDLQVLATKGKTYIVSSLLTIHLQLVSVCDNSFLTILLQPVCVCVCVT